MVSTAPDSISARRRSASAAHALSASGSAGASSSLMRAFNNRARSCALSARMSPSISRRVRAIGLHDRRVGISVKLRIRRYVSSRSDIVSQQHNLGSRADWGHHLSFPGADGDQPLRSHLADLRGATRAPPLSGPSLQGSGTRAACAARTCESSDSVARRTRAGAARRIVTRALLQRVDGEVVGPGGVQREHLLAQLRRDLRDIRTCRAAPARSGTCGTPGSDRRRAPWNGWPRRRATCRTTRASDSTLVPRAGPGHRRQEFTYQGTKVDAYQSLDGQRARRRTSTVDVSIKDAR